MGADRIANDNRVLRVVMPLDTAVSGAFVLLALAAVPALVLLDASAQVLWLVGLTVIVLALALAAMGAVTAWTLLRSMARGRYDLPPRLWLPLPRAAQPFPGGRTVSAERDGDD
jgi:predicted lysophospholipase L1 biosynthesis ABC-type transport system permease subunit